MDNSAKINDYQVKSVLAHSILDLHILPTEKCNFRCVYCYEDFLIGQMPPHVINGVKNLLLKRIHELKQLRISWFGGEPLAASKVVLDISNFAKNLATEFDCGYHFGMTTNGYLLDIKRFNALIDAGVTSFQISLDGTEECHDKTRLRADGSGTFNKIWTNLVAASKTKHQFEIVLRVHITPQNYLDVEKLLVKIKATFNNDERFTVFLKAIANLGGPNAGSFDVLTGKTKEEILVHLNSILGKDVNRHELGKPNAPYICYASAQNAWVIRANGTLAKCTVMFDDDRNKIGFLKEDGTFILENEKIQLWLRGLKDKNASVMGCPAYKLPKLTNSKLANIAIVTQ